METLLSLLLKILDVITRILSLLEKYFSRQKKESKAELLIEYEPCRPFELTDPASSKGHALRYQRILVRNISKKDLSNCIVKLEDMRRADGRDFNNAFLPVGLITQHQRLQQLPGGVFNLCSGESKLVEVACLNETDVNSEIELQYETSMYPNPVPRADYVLKLTAYGGSAPVETFFRLYVNEDGYLRLKKYP